MYTKLWIDAQHLSDSDVASCAKRLCDERIDSRHDRVNVGNDAMAFNALDGGVELQFPYTLMELPGDLASEHIKRVHLNFSAHGGELRMDSTGVYMSRDEVYADVDAYNDGSGYIHAFAPTLAEANKLLQDVRKLCAPARECGLRRL